MPESRTAAAPAPPTAGGPPAQQESFYNKIITVVQQVFFVWALTQLVTRFFAASTTAPPTAPSVSRGTPGEANLNAWISPPTHAHLAWNLGQKVDMHVYMSTSPTRDIFNAPNWFKEQDKELPKFVWGNISFGDWNEVAQPQEYEVQFPPSVLRNGSLWLDVFLTKNGASPNPNEPSFTPEDVHHVRQLLTPYLPRAKVRKEKKLLGATEAMEGEEPVEPDVILPHWHRNITLAIISDAVKIPYNTLPAPILDHIHLQPGARDETGTQGFYMPIIYPNDFWHLREHYVEVNSTTPSLPVRIVFQPISYFKFQMFASLTVGFKEAAKQQGASAGAELDEIKRMFIETNPWFLALTGAVSLLHVLFEMLAFKSDVSHWRQKKELVGVSVRTIVTNVFVQIIVLLYLIDNNESTSWMILFGSGTGVLIEAWKVTKAVDISFAPAPTGSFLPYKLVIKDKHVLSEDEKKTQEYDKLAYRYVSYVAIPLLAGYSVYSLIYETHRGWYSFVISTLTSFVYMFGFAQLVPQLIINYKLKSVAHMPMKAMIYKTLSTVVDDFFAFCIKMPFLHRLACFRDDVVFLIFLYQRWIYRVDPKRVNEYGQVLAEDVVAAAETKKDQ